MYWNNWESLWSQNTACHRILKYCILRPSAELDSPFTFVLQNHCSTGATLCSACVLEVLQCSHGQNCPDPSNHILSFLTGFQGLGLKSKPVRCVLWLCLCVQSQWKQLLLSFSSAGYSHPALSARPPAPPHPPHFIFLLYFPCGEGKVVN